MRKATRVSLALGTSAALLTLAAFPASAEDKTSDATITVQGGPLSIAVNAALASVELIPGETAEFEVPGVAVTDLRAGTDAWNASVSMSDFIAPAVKDSKPIPAAGTTYEVAADSLVGSSAIGALEAVPATLVEAEVEMAVVTTSNVFGNNTASWNATLNVPVPGNSLAGDYSAVLTHSVL